MVGLKMGEIKETLLNFHLLELSKAMEAEEQSATSRQ